MRIQLEFTPTCDNCGNILSNPDEVLCEKCKKPSQLKCKRCDDLGYYETLIETLADCTRCHRLKTYEN